MSIKSRIEALEAEKGGVLSVKFLHKQKDGTFLDGFTNKILIKKDDNYFFEDGTPLHGETKEENTRNIVITRKDERPHDASIREEQYQ